VTEIGPAGIALALPGVRYSGVPVVENGRLELTEVKAANDGRELVLSEDVFERGMEGGINRALHAHQLTPTAIALDEGSMTIRTEPTDLLARGHPGSAATNGQIAILGNSEDLMRSAAQDFCSSNGPNEAAVLTAKRIGVRQAAEERSPAHRRGAERTPDPSAATVTWHTGGNQQ
jgi:hypothetical protein